MLDYTALIQADPRHLLESGRALATPATDFSQFYMGN